MPSNHLILCHHFLPLPSIFPNIRIFSNKSTLHIRWPKFWGFSIGPSNEYSGLISFRREWFYLLAVQGSLKSLLSTTVQKHQFFSTQPSLYSNSHIHTWLLPLTVQALSVKWCPCFLIPRYVTASLPRSKCLLISWLQSPSEVILEPKKIKSVTASTFSPCYLPWSDGTRCHNLSFLKVEFQASFFTLFQPHQEDL